MLEQALGPSSAPPKGCGGGSTRSKVARILTGASEEISSHMKRSFVERRYSPSTGMDQNEWEIIFVGVLYPKNHGPPVTAQKSG
jgi:hypothetical protein